MHALERMPHVRELTTAQAQQWVEAALAEAKALRQHDGALYPLTDDAARVASARELHATWRAWRESADGLIRLLPADIDGEALLELKHQIARARALEDVPPEEILRRHRAVEDGTSRTYTVEEARRELGLPPRR